MSQCLIKKEESLLRREPSNAYYEPGHKNMYFSLQCKAFFISYHAKWPLTLPTVFFCHQAVCSQIHPFRSKCPLSWHLSKKWKIHRLSCQPGYVHFGLNTVTILHLKYAIKFILKCASHGGTMYAWWASIWKN